MYKELLGIVRNNPDRSKSSSPEESKPTKQRTKWVDLKDYKPAMTAISEEEGYFDTIAKTVTFEAEPA